MMRSILSKFSLSLQYQPSVMVSLSACIITYNEERNIARCIDAVKTVADEVIIVDSFSSDNTVAIAAQMGAKVFQRAFEGYGDQKFFAQQQATSDWVLSIDADEVVSPELAKSILEMKNDPRYPAYLVDILPNYCGHWIRHCGWYPQPKLRIWDRKRASMMHSKVHEGIELLEQGARTGRLKGDLLHYSYNTISDHLKKIEVYSEIGARADVARGKNCSLLKLLVAPKWQFFNDFVFRLGMLDGYWGYIVCRNNAFSSFVKYAKTRQFASLKKRGLPY